MKLFLYNSIIYPLEAAKSYFYNFEKGCVRMKKETLYLFLTNLLQSNVVPALVYLPSLLTSTEYGPHDGPLPVYRHPGAAMVSTWSNSLRVFQQAELCYTLLAVLGVPEGIPVPKGNPNDSEPGIQTCGQ